MEAALERIVEAGRELANKQNVTLHVHTPEGRVWESVGAG